MTNISNEQFMDSLTKENISKEDFNNLDLKQQGFLQKYNKGLYDKLTEEGLNDTDFFEISSNTESIDIEKFHKMTDKQKQIFKRLDIQTYQKMNDYYTNYSVDDYEKLNMNELQTFFKVNPTKYNELQAEMQELTSTRGQLIDETSKYYRMIKAKGMNDDNLKAITELMQKSVVIKYHQRFNEAVKQVLSLDSYTLKSMTKEAFRQKIEDKFKSSLPLSVFNLDR